MLAAVFGDKIKSVDVIWISPLPGATALVTSTATVPVGVFSTYRMVLASHSPSNGGFEMGAGVEASFLHPAIGPASSSPAASR